MDQLKGQKHLSGPVSGLCWVPPPFLMDMTFGHWSSDAASYFVNNLSSFLKSEGNTSHHAEICQV